MENFIRTKYSSKRWVLSPSPPSDPSILDSSSSSSSSTTTPPDDVPLAIIKHQLTSSYDNPTKSLPLTRENSLFTEEDIPPARRQTPELLPLRTESASPSRTRQDRVSNQSLLGLEFDSPVRTYSAPHVFPSGQGGR